MTDNDSTKQDGEDDALDKLLAELNIEEEPDKKAEPPKEPEKEPVKEPQSEDLEWLKEFRAREEQKQQRSEYRKIEAAVKKANDALAKLPDGAVLGYLMTQADEDPRITAAFNKRTENPKEFAEILSEYGKKLAEQLDSQPDPALTGDREAARAYVESERNRQATTDDTVPEQSKLAQMSAAELNKLAREQIAKGN